MSDLSRQARSLLAHAKQSDDGLPDDASLARSRRALLRKVGAGAGMGTAAIATGAAVKAAPAAATAATAGSLAAPTTIAPAAMTFSSLSVAAKGVVVAAIVAGAATGAVTLPARAPVASAPTISAPRAVVPPPAPRQIAPSPRETAHDTTLEAPVDDPPPAPVASVAPAPVPEIATARPPRARDEVIARRAVSAPVQRTPEAPPRPEATAPDSAPPAAAVRPTPASLSADIAHLRAAQLALAAGDPRRAREEAARVAPDGPLAEERDGMLALAACANGSADGAREVAAFAARHPGSSLVPRVRAACNASDSTTKR